MPGLVERVEETVFFDKPDGRIVQAVADINEAPIESVREYYRASLPQFGWVLEGEGSYKRGSESLQLSFEDAVSGVQLRVVVQPR